MRLTRLTAGAYVFPIRSAGSRAAARITTIGYRVWRERARTLPLGSSILRALGLLILEVASAAICPLLAPLFYWRLLTTDPQDVAVLPPGDITDLHYPYQRWVAEQMARGDPVWWNPYVSAGHSAIGDIQFHTLYPPDNLLASVAGGSLPFLTFEKGIIAHVALGAFFMYLLGRRLTGSRIGGLTAGIVFAFGGYLTSYTIQQVILLETSVWLPFVLLAIDVGAGYNVVAAFVAGSAGVALAALAGHPQTLFYVVVAAGFYAIFRGWNAGRPRLAVILGAPVLFIGGLGLSANALVPAFLHLDLTDRTNVTYAFSSTGFDLHEALGIVLPVQFGGYPLYNGVISLVLVGVALMARRRRSEKLFWVGLGVAGLLFSFGGKTFLESLAYLGLGSFKFRDHERLAFFVSVSVAILAAFGAAEVASRARVDFRWLRRSIKWPLAFIGVTVILIEVAWSIAPRDLQHDLYSPLDRLAFTAVLLILAFALLLARECLIVHPSVAGLLLVILIAVDLFSTNWQNNLAAGQPDQQFQQSPLVEYLQSYTSGVFRIASEGQLPADGNAGALFRLEDTVGNSPLEMKDYAEFNAVVPEITRWQILNVRYVITLRKLDDPRFRLLRQDGPRNLYEIDPTLQRARVNLVTKVLPAPSHHDALEILKSVDVRTEAVIEGNPDLSILAAPASPTTPTPGVAGGSTVATATGPARVESVSANQIVADSASPNPGLLVLSDVDYPGWHAQVDGVHAPIYRTNGIVRGVLLPAGNHQVKFWFDPPGVALVEAIRTRIPFLLVYVILAEVVVRALWLAFVWARWLYTTRRRLDVTHDLTRA